MSQTLKKLALLLVTLAILLALAASALFMRWSNSPLVFNTEGLAYQVQPGSHLTRIANDFQQLGLIQSKYQLLLLSRLTGQRSVKRGEYLFSEGSTPRMVLDQLYRGDVVRYQLTLVEGRTFKQWLSDLADSDKLISKLNGLSWADQKRLLAIDVDHPEGWFYPDTYDFQAGDSDITLLRRAHKVMREQLDQQWQNRAKDLPYKSAYEALIMASIVERETGAPQERPEIAGVFVRRLNKGMRLQTDPTVIYGMGERYKGNIRRRDLKTPTPYNTYTINGLPPTPIAMPGLAAIQAALNPKAGKSLYFVARGDGSHQFSETLEAHNRAVREYQLKRRSDYRSSPQ